MAGVTVFIGLIESVAASVILLALRRTLGYAYSSEEEVINYVTSMVPLACISVITDGLQGVLSGDILTINLLHYCFSTGYKTNYIYRTICQLPMIC